MSLSPVCFYKMFSGIGTFLFIDFNLLKQSTMIFVDAFTNLIFLILASNANGQSCTCNVINETCEVNCCCDSDCASGDILTYQSCTNQLFDISTQLCITDQVVWSQDRHVESIVRQNDLFCVVENTFTERNFYVGASCIENNSCFANLEPEFNYVSVPGALTFQESFYKSGDPIAIEYPSNALSLLSAPMQGVSGLCLDYSPVKYLVSRTASCSRMEIDLASLCASNTVVDFNIYQNFIVYSAPPTSMNASQVNVGRECVVSGLQGSCANPILNGAVCNYAVTSVSYQVITDSFNGIERVNALFVLQNISSNDLPLVQSFSVSFQTVTNENRDASQRSGNPGYLVGYPLLGLRGNSSNNVSVTDIFLIKPDSTGLCTGSRSQVRLPIRFGHEERTGCQMSVGSNCTALQNEIYTFFDMLTFNSGNTVFVGIFGNANLSDPFAWLQLIQANHSADPSTNTSGCNGIVLSSNYEIAFANSGLISNPQPKLVSIRHSYGDPVFLRYVCPPGPSCNQLVEISTSVKFVDVSETIVAVQTDTPTIKEKLPVNFFFPLKNIVF